MANNALAQLSISPEAGLNIGNARYTVADGKFRPGTGTIVSPRFGALLQIPLYKGLHLQPGIFYSVKGASLISNEYVTSSATFTMNYIELPLNLLYRYNLGKAGGVFISAGPYAAMAFYGQKRGNSTDIGDINFGNNPGEFDRLDYGLNFGLGYITPIGFYFKGQYSTGLANLENTPGASYKNQALNISVGYTFYFKKKIKQSNPTSQKKPDK